MLLKPAQKHHDHFLKHADADLYIESNMSEFEKANDGESMKPNSKEFKQTIKKANAIRSRFSEGAFTRGFHEIQ